MIELKNNPAGNFFLLAGPCVIEGEEMAMRIAERVVKITEALQIPYVFKGSYRKANRSRLDSFTGIGDEKALKVLRKVHETFGIPTVTDIHTADEAAMANTFLVFSGTNFASLATASGVPVPPDSPPLFPTVRPSKLTTSRHTSSSSNNKTLTVPALLSPELPGFSTTFSALVVDV